MDRNDVTLVGRLSASPDERAMPSGDTLTKWRIIVRRRPLVRRGGFVDTIQWRHVRRRGGGHGEGDATARFDGDQRGASVQDLRPAFARAAQNKSWRHTRLTTSVEVDNDTVDTLR
ncbi:hypothetical protein [Nonomuraea dietziae]|uniref:hypothetical protein n=1 Tax=Nonomuraea dietziae TaxID=65515 RepID=UPI0031E46FC1